MSKKIKRILSEHKTKNARIAAVNELFYDWKISPSQRMELINNIKKGDLT